MLIHLLWLHQAPIPAYLVKHARAWKAKGHITSVWTPGLLQLNKWSNGDDVVRTLGGVVMDARIEPETFTLLDPTQTDAAVAIYSDALTAQKLEYAQYEGYPVHTIGYDASTGAGQAQTNGKPVGPTPFARTMPPPELANYEFVLYAAPSVRIDSSLLNDGVANMLNTNAVVGVRHHLASYPCIHEQYTFHYTPSTVEWKARTGAYIGQRLSGGFKRGSDGAVDVYDTDVVLRDMRHPEQSNMNNAWFKEQAYTDSPHISFFFVRQMLVSRVHVLPPRVDMNCHVQIHARLHISPDIPVVPRPNTEANIPAKLHLVWLGPDPPTEYCVANFEGWKRLMPQWEIKLWRNGDEAEFGPDVEARVAAATKGAQKADILRAFIMEKYGGIYMDADVEPVSSLDVLRYLGEPIILCHDLPLSWAYISVGFYAAVPHHPLFIEYCKHVMSANVTLNTTNVHMHTGPRALGYVVAKLAPPDGGKYFLLPAKAFYHNAAVSNAFGRHTYAKSWL